MRLPDETVADSFLPTFRYMLARELVSRKFKESEIAHLMGLSQAAISKYHRGATKIDKTFTEDEATKKAVKQVADGLQTGEMSHLQSLAVMMQLVRTMQTRGLLCRLHEKEFPEIAGTGCNLCLAPIQSDVLEEENVLSDLRTALRLLESTNGFAALVPNVGTNLAMAKRNAKDLRDVAGVPGRIYEMRGGVRIPAGPEFEASTHVAGLILSASRADRRIRAGINIRFSEDILAACESLGWRPVEVRGEYKGREDEISQKLAKQKQTPRAIYHRGAFGIEPIIYIVGETATDVVERVRRLLGEIGR